MENISLATYETKKYTEKHRGFGLDSQDAYCRLCAQAVPRNKQLDLRNDDNKRDQFSAKLTRLNVPIDFNDDELPTTVCYECCSSLQDAYSFVITVESAKTILINLKSKFFPDTQERKDPIKIEDNDDQQDYDMALSPVQNDETDSVIEDINIEKSIPKLDTQVVAPVKNESESIASVKQSSTTHNTQLLLPIALKGTSSTIKITIPLIVPSTSKTNNNIPSELDLPPGKTWKDYKWKCQLCDTEYATCNELIEHSKSEHGRCNTFTCMDCNRKSSTLKVLLAHMYKTHINRRCLRLCCFICFQPFKTPAEKTAHHSAHMHYAYVCDGCNTEFRTAEELNEHKSKFFNSRNQYTKEALREFEGKFEGLTCLICNKTLVTRNGLYTHLKIHYGMKHTCVCDVCGKGCENKTALKVHMISHTDERPFKCEICPDTFKTERALRKHVMAHDKQKRFACETCGKKFRLLQTLNSHKSIHSDSFPYVCDVCNKCFRCRAFLNRHMRQHTGEKPYSCETCNHFFTYWSNYNKHMTTVHGKDMSKRKRLEGDGGRLVKEINDKKLLEWMEKTLEGPSRSSQKKKLNMNKKVPISTANSAENHN